MTLKKIALTLPLIIFSLNAQENDDSWKKRYQMVKEDIQQINQIKKKDIFLALRLFQLQSEKLNLLLEVENKIILSQLDENSSKNKDKLTTIRALINQDQKEIEKISELLENKTSDPSILSQIYYFKGLNHYSLKNQSEFHKNFKLAESKCTNKDQCYKIKLKLADYYYNEGNFQEAIKYYLQVIKTDTLWISKNHFNLAWSYFKLDSTNEALHYLKIAKTYSDNSKYFPIGKQLEKSISLFYAHSRKTNEGLKYLKDNGMFNFEYIFNFIKDTAEHGKTEDVIIIFKETDQFKKSPTEKEKLLIQKITYLRTLKRFDLIDNEINSFSSSFKNDTSVPTETRQELIKTILDYNGFIHEFLKTNATFNFNGSEKSIDFIKNNLTLLRQINPEATTKYYFYEGEAFFSISNFQKATYSYLEGIEGFYKKSKLQIKQSSEETLYLKRSFDSVFKSLESVKDIKSTEKSFQYYLYFYPTQPRSREVYQRLVDFKISDTIPLNALVPLYKYSKAFPDDLKIQQDTLRKLVSYYVKNEDIDNIVKIKKHIDKDFLKLKSELSISLDEIISTIELKKIEEGFSTKSSEISISSLDKIKEKYIGLYEIEYRILLKKLEFAHTKALYPKLPIFLKETLSALKPSEKNKFSPNINFYLNQTCLNSSLDVCYDIIENAIKSHIQLNEENENLYFRTIVAQKKFDQAHQLANTQTKKDYFFNILMLEYPNGESNYFNQFPQKNIDALSFILEQKLWRIYFKTKSLKEASTFITKIKVSEINQNLNSILNAYLSAAKAISLDLPTPPTTPENKEIDFEEFSIFLKNFAEKFSSEFAKIDTSIQNIHPNFINLYIDSLNTKINDKSLIYKNYIPKTTNTGLEKAILNEMLQVSNLLLKKIELYNDLSSQSWTKVTPNVGKEFYKIKENSDFFTFGKREVITWEDF